MAAHLDADAAEPTVARLVRRVVTDDVTVVDVGEFDTDVHLPRGGCEPSLARIENPAVRFRSLLQKIQTKAIRTQREHNMRRR
ncbi:MAG TPA: hypothetical protein VF064_06820 [Pyrinomonadaceae bacterium]